MNPEKREAARIARFWRYVDKRPSGCWEWTRYARNGTEPQFRGPGGIVPAQCFAWGLDGRRMPEGLPLVRVCANPKCVRPAHCKAMTPEEAGAASAGRCAKGSEHPNAKLTESKVATIRNLRAKGWTLARIGARYGVSGATISNIGTGRTWCHVPAVRGHAGV